MGSVCRLVNLKCGRKLNIKYRSTKRRLSRSRHSDRFWTIGLPFLKEKGLTGNESIVPLSLLD